MSIQVSPCDESDFTLDLMELLFGAFGGKQTLINAMHPDNLQPSGQAKALVFCKVLFQNSLQRWVKATDLQSGRIVGLSQWVIYENTRPQIMPLKGPPGNWSTPDDEEWCAALYTSLLKNRIGVLSEKASSFVGGFSEFIAAAQPHPPGLLSTAGLLKMAVAPSFQRRGIGTLLMDYGLQNFVRPLRAELSVESTEAGKKLYAAHGLVPHHLAILDVPDKFADRPKEELLIMSRPSD